AVVDTARFDRCGDHLIANDVRPDIFALDVFLKMDGAAPLVVVSEVRDVDRTAIDPLAGERLRHATVRRRELHEFKSRTAREAVGTTKPHPGDQALMQRLPCFVIGMTGPVDNRSGAHPSHAATAVMTVCHATPSCGLTAPRSMRRQ